jgi:hypothetical protein
MRGEGVKGLLTAGGSDMGTMIGAMAMPAMATISGDDMVGMMIVAVAMPQWRQCGVGAKQLL